jgi:hypothetical protein
MQRSFESFSVLVICDRRVVGEPHFSWRLVLRELGQPPLKETAFWLGVREF